MTAKYDMDCPYCEGLIDLESIPKLDEEIVCPHCKQVWGVTKRVGEGGDKNDPNKKVGALG